MERNLNDELAELLQLSTLTLATTSVNGEPHATPVYFAAVDSNPQAVSLSLRLYFFSETHSQHARDITSSPISAVALYPECHGWEDIYGLQMHGKTQSVPKGQEWERAWDAYRLKFPFVTALKKVIARNTFYVFTPNWVRLVDNRRSFGYKREWKLENNES